MHDLGEYAEMSGILMGYRDRHHILPAAVTRSCRAARLARSMRATSLAGISYSSWSRQANTTKVAKAPTKPAATIHQMCQIMAKPITVAKKAQTKPVDELRGSSMGCTFRPFPTPPPFLPPSTPHSPPPLV